MPLAQEKIGLPKQSLMATVAFFDLFSYPLTWVVTSIVFVLYYWKGGWLQRCIQKSGLEKQA